MGDLFNQDFKEFLKALNHAEVKYLLVGGYAVILHGYQRSTGDMDIWVYPSKKNHAKLMNAFKHFGLPTSAVPINKFLDVDKYDVFTFGISPVAIDIMTKVKGLSFEESYKNALIYETDGIRIPLLHYNQLVVTKKASGRFKDLADLEYLEQE